MKARSLLLLTVLLQFAFLGCAEKKEIASGGSNDDTNVVGGGTVPGEGVPEQDGLNEPDDDGWGVAVPFIVNQDNFSDFSNRNPETIDFENTRLYYKVDKDGENYKATIRVYYRYTTITGGWGDGVGQANVEQRSPKFESGTTSTDIQFNKVYMQDGNTYWIAFAEEKVWNPLINSYRDFTNFDEDFGGPAKFGSIMIVLDDVSESGSSGKVYYRNFDYSQCFTYWGGHICPDKPQAEGNENYKCWNIKAGPYECREFVAGNNPMNAMLEGVDDIGAQSLDSPNFYKLLGEVEGMFIPGLN